MNEVSVCLHFYGTLKPSSICLLHTYLEMFKGRSSSNTHAADVPPHIFIETRVQYTGFSDHVTCNHIPPGAACLQGNFNFK